VAGCVQDARLVDKSPVMLRGQVTIKASDGRLASFAYPLRKQVPVYTDVISPLGGGCLSADAVFYSACAAVRAAISCQDPAA